jgi:glycerol-3-phosphate cytidylyltransferase-like family protein
MAQKSILLFGTFDIFHKGHMGFFQDINDIVSSKDYKLIVGLLSTKLSFSKNGDLPIDSYITRYNRLSKIECIDEIVYVDRSIIDTIKTINPNIIAIGYNQEYLKCLLENQPMAHKIPILETKGYNIDFYSTRELRENKSYLYSKK